MKLSIIGGGISGCISAYLLSELGHEVSLFEKQDKLGGVIKDIKDKNDIFFNGPHYLSQKSFWLKKLRKDKLLNNALHEFNGSYLQKKDKVNVYKSYVDLFDREEVNNLFAQPFTSLKFKKLNLKKRNELLKNRLSNYQKNIKKPIENWCKRFSPHYPNLHKSCAEIMSITRVFFSRDEKKLKILKKKNVIADNILGLPMLASDRIFCVPKDGYDDFFEKLEKLLIKKINLNLNSKIKIIKKNNNSLSLLNHNKLIISDKIIWAANPIPLMNTLKFSKFDNPIVRTKIYCANIKFENETADKNFYIQVFSEKSNIFRIYVYKIQNKLKITIETIMEDKDNKLNTKFLKTLFLKFKMKIKFIGKFIEKKEIRHILITQSDHNKFLKFEKKFKNTNIIGGGWHLFGKDNKINYIMNQFE